MVRDGKKNLLVGFFFHSIGGFVQLLFGRFGFGMDVWHPFFLVHGHRNLTNKYANIFFPSK